MTSTTTWTSPPVLGDQADISGPHASDPMHARLVQLALAALLTGTAACSWSRLADSRPLPAGSLVQVWSGGQVIQLHDSKTEGDSLVGHLPLPDTVRHAVALATIDSVRVQDMDPGKMLIVGTGVAMAVLYAFAQGLNFR